MTWGDLSWSQAANVAVSGLIALVAGVFVVAYHVLAPWRSTSTGRHVMAVTATIGLFGAYSVAITQWPTGGVAMGLRMVRLGIGLALVGLLVQRTWMVVRAQRGGAARRARRRGRA
jgi:hypothetical protein